MYDSVPELSCYPNQVTKTEHIYLKNVQNLSGNSLQLLRNHPEEKLSYGAFSYLNNTVDSPLLTSVTGASRLNCISLYNARHVTMTTKI